MYFVLGRLWFRVLFGSRWDALAGIAPGQHSADPVPAIVSAAMSIVLAYTIAIVLAMTRGHSSLASGSGVGLILGVGIAASSMLAIGLREGRAGALWLIDAGYVVVGCIVIGAIVGAWKRSNVL